MTLYIMQIWNDVVKSGHMSFLYKGMLPTYRLFLKAIQFLTSQILLNQGSGIFKMNYMYLINTLFGWATGAKPAA